jgi:predicted glycogen debranching enzyme
MADTEHLPACEWLVTNGLGGYASGTVSGDITRRYHGLLVAAMPAPLGRIMLLPHLSEQIRLADGRIVRISGGDRLGGPPGSCEAPFLTEFHLEAGLPVWRYNAGGLEFEKRIVLSHRQNTVYVIYRLVKGPDRVRIKLLPSVHFRPHSDPVSTPLPGGFRLVSEDGRHELSAGPAFPTLRMRLFGPRRAFTSEPRVSQCQYHLEEARGYDSRGELWSPGYFRLDMALDQNVAVAASVESWETISALSPADVMQAEAVRRARLLGDAHVPANSPLARDLVFAADQFVIVPVGRTADAARVQAAGDEARTIIAGYHWFTDWGRDTMISLEGLTLLTGRIVEAGYILRTFAHYVRNGLIPNLFPEGDKESLYHTADATLWFFHALSRYLAYSGDRAALSLLLPRLKDIIEHHLHGTDFGIGVDPGPTRTLGNLG